MNFLRRFTIPIGRSFRQIVTYEEIKNLPKTPKKVLIDVRNPSELQETGTIPCSINIPLPDVENALKMKPELFKKTYSVDKPSEDKELIFSCLKGIRAQTATDTAAKLGYKNAKPYLGSWTEWAEKEGLQKK